MKGYLVGVDEVGRGPLAGPVCVGACAVPGSARRRFAALFRGVKDSKALAPEARERWATLARKLRRDGVIDFQTSFVGETVIDRRGIAFAIRLAIRRTLAKLAILPGDSLVLLDGGIRAPEVFVRQETIVGGDSTERIIALASIVAKVRRDRRMVLLARRFPEYGFDEHKGYGTKKHYLAIRKHGLCPIHRRSFLKNISGAARTART